MLQDINASDLCSDDPTTSGNDHGEATSLDKLIQTPLPPGKTLIIYHPHAQHPPEVVDTNTLSLLRKRQPSHFGPEPWAPFASRDDFEQAELFIKHNSTNHMIDAQLHLNQKRDSHHHPPAGLPPMKNAREMHKILEEARSDLDMSSVCSSLPVLCGSHSGRIV
jgi:hypothetical protein